MLSAQKLIYLTANTTCNPLKFKSGDASFADVLYLNSKEVFVLLVADGVSKAPKDWLASASTVKLILEYFKNNPTIPFPDLLYQAIIYAHDTIISGIEETIGMLSTLSTLIFIPETQKVYTANIGDSRIYGYRHKTWHQLTVDDSTTNVYKENGKIILHNGVPFMRSALTKAIGGNNNLDIQIKERNVSEYAGYCLVSDGFYEMANWENSIRLIYESADMQKTIHELTPHFQDIMKDDASVAMFRTPELNTDINLIPNKNNKLENNDISKAILLPSIEKTIQNALENKEEKKITDVLQWMKVNNLSFSKVRMIELLDEIIRHKYRSSIVLLKDMIRKF